MPAKPGTKPLKPLKKGMGLYQVLYWPKEAAKAGKAGKPWAVVNIETHDVNGRWHATKEEALDQAKALYARLGDKAKVQSEIHNAFLRFADSSLLNAEDGVKWIEAIAPKTYHTPAYGAVTIGDEKIDNFVNSIIQGVRGQEIAINYEHGLDRAKGDKAAGWIRDARKNKNGNLEIAVDFTEPAKEEIRNKEWKYFSLEWDDAWEHPDGVIYKDVVMGGALTNRPVAKGLMPINFSEIFSEKSDYEFATWTTAYMNDLPDSAFLFVESDKKDAQGRTVPRSNRHFPYKDANGKVDLPHLRNAIARIPQADISVDKDSLQNKARALLAKHGGSMSEVLELDDETKAWLENESKEMEHSEPGSGNPPIPRTDEDNSDDPAIKGGWRRGTPPIVEELENTNKADDGVLVTFSEAEAEGYLHSAISGLNRIHTNAADAVINRIEDMLAQDRKTRSFNELKALTTEVRQLLRGEDDTSITSPSKGGNTVGELTEKDIRELRNVLDVDDDGKIVEAVKVRFGELNALRDAVSASEQERIFAEQYPQFYAEHMNLMERDRKNTATKFAESVQKVRKQEGYGLKDTRQGLSVATLEMVTEAYMKFAEGKGTVADFEEVVKAIVNGGIVQFGELGSSSDDDIPDFDTNSAVGVAAARKTFAEVVAKIRRENPGMEYLEAVSEASKKHPDLADTYKITLPA